MTLAGTLWLNCGQARPGSARSGRPKAAITHAIHPAFGLDLRCRAFIIGISIGFMIDRFKKTIPSRLSLGLDSGCHFETAERLGAVSIDDRSDRGAAKCG